MTRWRTRPRRPRADRGAAAVEFAIVLTVLLLIIFGIIDFGRLLFTTQAVKSASREGARTAVISTGTSSATGATVNAAIAQAGESAGALAGGGALSSTWALGTNAGTTIPNNSTDTLCRGNRGQSITVRVSIPFDWLTPVGSFVRNVNAVASSTTMRCE